MNDQFLLNKDQFTVLLSELNRASDLFDQTKSQFGSLPQHDWSALEEIAQFAPALDSSMATVKATLEEISKDFKLLIDNLFEAFALFEDLDESEKETYAQWLVTLLQSFDRLIASLNVANLGATFFLPENVQAIGGESAGSAGQEDGSAEGESVNADVFAGERGYRENIASLNGQVAQSQEGKG